MGMRAWSRAFCWKPSNTSSISTFSLPCFSCLCSLILRSTSESRGRTRTRGAYAQLPIILRRHVLVLLDPPRPREILHPKFLSLIYVHRPRLCYLEDSQHLGRDRSARWGIIPETRNDACVVVVFNEDPAQLRGARTACTMVSIHTTTHDTT